MIPDEAVEVVAQIIAGQQLELAHADGHLWTIDRFLPKARRDARKYLEAAAPHLSAPILALHSKAIGSYADADGCKWTGDHCQHCRREWPCATAEIVGVRL